MKTFLLTAAVVVSAAFAASAQTPIGTPPSGTQGQSGTALPSGATSTRKPDATIGTQVNADVNEANPADRSSRKTSTKTTKTKGGKMRTKTQSQSTSNM